MGQIIQDDGQMIRFFRLDIKRRFDDSDLLSKVVQCNPVSNSLTPLDSSEETQSLVV
jgi:hypothetical protein